MGPPESPTRPRKNQADGQRKRRPRRPRRCLLKGCEQRFYARRAHQRYCSEDCRKAARQWSRWKAQQRYRGTAAGQARRNGQSRRYRERIKSRKLPEPEAVDEAARVITNQHFFRQNLRPARLLRTLCASTAKSFAALLFARMPTRAGTNRGAREALEAGAHLVRTY
jgi:hypothetical protein